MKHGVHHSPLVIPRSAAPDIIRLQGEDGIIEDYDAKEFTRYFGIGTIIRILNDEYPYIDHNLPFLTHFNMEFSGHKPGTKVILPRILRQGYFKGDEDEVLPVLSVKNVYIGTVAKKREHIPYDTLLPEAFTYSMKHIKSPLELKKAILRRYTVSMPLLSDDEILARGVGMTVIKLEGIFEI